MATKVPSDYSTNLSGYWLLGEASGTRADSSGNGNTLTDNNTVLARNGFNDTLCADFERSQSEYLSITDAAQTDLDITSSYSAWVKLKMESITNDNIWLGKWSPSTGYMIAIQATGLIVVNHGTTAYTSQITIVIGEVMEVGVVYDDANNLIHFYVNGKLVDTKAATVDPADTSHAFQLGARSDGTDYFDGCQAQAAVWKGRVLTHLEMSSMSPHRTNNAFNVIASANNNPLTGTYTKQAMSFTSVDAGEFSGVELLLFGLNTPTDETVTVRLETDSSDKPSGSLVHANAISSALDATKFTLGTGGDWVMFKFTDLVTLVAGTKYWIVLEQTAGSWGAEKVDWRNTVTATDFPGGHCDRYSSGSWDEDIDARNGKFKMVQFVGGAITSVTKAHGTVAESEFGSNTLDDKFAQNFKFTENTTIYGASFFVSVIGAPAFNIVSKILSDSSNLPNSVLATSNTILSSRLQKGSLSAADFYWVFFGFASPYVMLANTEYWLSIETPDSGHSGTNYMGAARITSSTFPQTNDAAFWDDTAGVWAAVSGTDPVSIFCALHAQKTVGGSGGDSVGFFPFFK